MKLVAKCSSFPSLPFQVHIKVCNLIPLNIYILILFKYESFQNLHSSRKESTSLFFVAVVFVISAVSN